MSTAESPRAALSSSRRQPPARCHDTARDAQTRCLQHTPAAEKPATIRGRAWTQCLTCLALHLQKLMPDLGTNSSYSYTDNLTTADSTYTHKKSSSSTSTGLMNKIKYSSKSTFSPYNCTYINTLLVSKKKEFTKNTLPAVAVPMYRTILGPPFPQATAAAQSANRIFQKSLCMCLHTHRDVQTHTGEEGREIC